LFLAEERKEFRFDSPSVVQLSSLETFLGLLSYSGYIPIVYLKIDHGHFYPNPVKLIVHTYSLIRIYRFRIGR
jgi:hypothetical protein